MIILTGSPDSMVMCSSNAVPNSGKLPTAYSHALKILVPLLLALMISTTTAMEPDVNPLDSVGYLRGLTGGGSGSFSMFLRSRVHSTWGKIVISLLGIVIPSATYKLGNALYRSIKLRHIRSEHPFHAKLIDRVGLSAETYSDMVDVNARPQPPDDAGRPSAQPLLPQATPSQVFYDFVNRLLQRLKWRGNRPLDVAVQEKSFDKRSHRLLVNTLAKALQHNPRWQQQKLLYWVCGRLLPSRLMNEEQFEQNIFYDWMELLKKEDESIWTSLERKPVSKYLSSRGDARSPYSMRTGARFTMPYEFNGPSPNKAFVKREELLQQMRVWALEGINQDGRCLLILEGMGGIGKTQLAIYFFHNPPIEYDMRIWLFAATTDYLQSQYVDVYVAYRKQYEPSLQYLSEADPLEERASHVLSWLNHSGVERRFLIVYDNVTSKETIEPWLPSEASRHHVIVTSRNRSDWVTSSAYTGESDEIVDVNEMSRDESRELMSSYLGPESHSEGFSLEGLAALFGDLPLALTQAVYYMKKQRVDALSYKEQYENDRKRLLGTGIGFSLSAAHEPVLVTYNVILRELYDTFPQALELLKHLAWMASQQVPEELARYLVGRFPGISSVEAAFPHLRTTLEEYGLIRVDNVTHQISLHPVLQVVVCVLQTESDMSLSVSHWLTCCDVVNQLVDEYDSKGSLEYRYLLSHAEALHEQSNNICNLSLQARARRRQQWCSLSSYSSLNSRWWCFSSSMPPSREGEALKIEPWCLGRIYKGIGHFKKEKRYYEHVLSVKRVLYANKQSHPGMAMAMNQLGNAMLSTGEYQEAKHYFEQALRINKKIYKENHPKVLDTRENLAEAMQSLGDAQRAKEYYQHVLSIRREQQEQSQQMGQGSPEYEHANWNASYGSKELATTLFGLGNALKALGDAKNAKECYKEALCMRRNLYADPNHPAIAAVLWSLGNALSKLGDAEGAKEHLKQALSIEKEYYGENHVEVAKTLKNLGNAFRQLGDAQRATECQKQALSIEKEYYGATHVEVARTWGNLGIALRQLGYAQGAKECLEEALSIKKEYYVTTHVEVAKTLECLGNALSDLGDAQGAKENHEQALFIKKEYYGENHVEMAITMGNLGTALRQLGCAQRAKELYEHALSIKKAYYGEGHVEVAKTLECLGITLSDLGYVQLAKQLLEQVVSVKKWYYGETHEFVGKSLLTLASVERALQHLYSTRRCFQEAFSILMPLYGSDSHTFAEALARAGDDLWTLGDVETSQECYREALPMLRWWWSADDERVVAMENALRNY
eukprot:gb/GECG01013583.1/.p1 GENE.gb/GECG01013583.1/~~gb/GECG01013583.1/.p1  ORF type:complete len:1287 (+),score=164.63 gb/GECG01013583.1/:1-3861(+)